MHRFLTILTALALAAGLGAAEHDHAGHDHGGGNGGHDHAAGHGDEGKAHSLGQVAVGGATFAVTLHGEVTAGGEAVLGIAVAEGAAPAELRSWIGIRNGRGSVKALLEADDHGHYHGHLEVPESLPEDSAVWLEVVTDAGRERGSVALPEAGHGHDQKAGTGHDHGEHKGHDHGEHEGHDH